MKISVLYDTGLLGHAYVEPEARTGVYRVVKKVAESLAASEQIDLYLNTNHHYRRAAEEYLSHNAILSKIDTTYSYLSGNPLADTIRNIYERKEKATFTKNLHTHKLERLPFSIWEKILKITYAIVEKPCEIYINTKTRKINNCQIFHTPFFPVPDFIKKEKRTKNFTTVHDLIPILFPQYCEKGTIDFVTKVYRSIGTDEYALAVSQSTKNDLCNYLPRLDPERVSVTSPAADPNVFYPNPNVFHQQQIRKKYNIPPDIPYFLSLCTLEPRKNVDHVIRCFINLLNQEHLPEVRLVLVGTKGWKYGKIFDEIDNHARAKERIIMTGFAHDADLSALYSGALGFVYMSFYEGFGLPPLEAMQCGVPVITSNTSSLPEVVGNAGLMLDPYDSDALSQALLTLYQDAALRTRMQQASLAQAKHFSWDKCTGHTIEAYRKAIG